MRKGTMRLAGSLLAGLLAMHVLWFLVVAIVRPPAYLLPNPFHVWSKLFQDHDIFLHHTWVTTKEFGLGLALGFVLAFILACLAVYSRTLDAVISPAMVMMQSIPKIALAPLFIIWFGYGMGPKIWIAALVSFFPIFINLHGGMKGTSEELVDYGRSIRLGRLKTVLEIRLPFAMPYLFAALKMSTIYSIVGAIVAEFVGSDQGIGYILIQGDLSFDSILLFGGILVLILLGMALYFFVGLLELAALRWQAEDDSGRGYVVTA